MAGTGENEAGILQFQQVLLVRCIPREHRNSYKTEPKVGEKSLR